MLRRFFKSGLQKTLSEHFGRIETSQIVTAARDFPITSRVDLQSALDDWFRDRPATRQLGVHTQMSHETPTLAQLLVPSPFGVVDIGPLQHDEVDVGDPVPVRCLKNGLWLSSKDGVPFAVLLSPSLTYGRSSGVHIEVGVPAGERGAAMSQAFFRDIEVHVAAGKTYRGRVISLESQHDYSGRGGSRMTS